MNYSYRYANTKKQLPATILCMKSESIQTIVICNFANTPMHSYCKPRVFYTVYSSDNTRTHTHIDKTATHIQGILKLQHMHSCTQATHNTHSKVYSSYNGHSCTQATHNTHSKVYSSYNTHSCTQATHNTHSKVYSSYNTCIHALKLHTTHIQRYTQATTHAFMHSSYTQHTFKGILKLQHIQRHSCTQATHNTHSKVYSSYNTCIHVNSPNAMKGHTIIHQNYTHCYTLYTVHSTQTVGKMASLYLYAPHAHMSTRTSTPPSLE